jgi:hypothetical protein
VLVNNVLAGVAVSDLNAAGSWYEKVLGEPGRQPMKEVFEWSLPRGGVLQVFEDPERAGSSSVTFSVVDLDRHLARLSRDGINAEDRTSSQQVSSAIVHDPDGNQVVLAEQHSATLAR